MELNDLTKAEEQVMQAIWALEKAFVKEVINYLPEPHPAYQTLSTIIGILENKGFLGHEAFGKAHQYFPLISKEDYRRHATDKLLEHYYDNSIESMLSFLVTQEKVDLSNVEEILNMIYAVKNRPR